MFSRQPRVRGRIQQEYSKPKTCPCGLICFKLKRGAMNFSLKHKQKHLTLKGMGK